MGIAQTILTLGPVYQALLGIPAAALENAMACRVYRAAALGFIDDGTEETSDPGMFTTVLSENEGTDNIALKSDRLDMKSGLHHRGEFVTDSSSMRKAGTISDRV